MDDASSAALKSLMVACADQPSVHLLCCFRVLERYPTNGKLLKIYGRFLEYVRNDPWGRCMDLNAVVRQARTAAGRPARNMLGAAWDVEKQTWGIAG